MQEFTIEDMSCSHCVGVITRTVHQLDPAARVEADLSAKKVRIDTQQAREDLARAIEDAGYTPA
jgi:copper chaperone